MRQFVLAVLLLGLPVLALTPVITPAAAGTGSLRSAGALQAKQTCGNSKSKPSSKGKCAKAKSKPTSKPKCPKGTHLSKGKCVKPKKPAAKPTATRTVPKKTPLPTYVPVLRPDPTPPAPPNVPTATPVPTPTPTTLTLAVRAIVPMNENVGFVVCGVPAPLQATFAPNPAPSKHDTTSSINSAATTLLTITIPPGAEQSRYSLSIYAASRSISGGSLVTGVYTEPRGAILTVGGPRTSSLSGDSGAAATSLTQCTTPPPGY